VPAPAPWTEDEVEAMARTLAGECYDDRLRDKRLVCEVILNRVANGYWGSTIQEVVSAPGQFHGYWRLSREITDSDRETVKNALKDWCAGGYEPLSEYLYFEAGPNHENMFRAKY
jgi:spore germination cell wall hydrolase CwlJ-like protein